MAVKERIDVEGNFKQQLNDLISSLSKSNNAVKNLTENIVQSAKQSENSISYFDRRVNQLANNLVKQGNTVKESILKATKQVEQEQEQSIERVAKQYIKLGSTIQDAYKNAKNAVGVTYNATPSNFSSSESTSNGGINDLIKSFVGSKLGKGLSVLGIIGTEVKAIQGTFKLANNISNQTLNAMNTLTNNMISTEGLKESLQNAMDFEDVKTNIDVLSKQLGYNGQKIYEDATKLAMATRFTEKDVASNATWMLKAGVNPDERLLTALNNIASLKPELGASHAGFAVFDAMLGRVTSLKTNYGIDNEKLLEFQKTLTGQDSTDTKNAIKKAGSGTKVNDKNAYVTLLEKYVESKYGNLSKEQSQTLSGLFSTMTGSIEQLASDLMGFNTKNGVIENGSVIYELKKAMGSVDEKTGTGTGFLGWLIELKDNPAFISIQQQLGSLVQELVNVGQELVSSGFIDEMMNVASEFIGKINEFIQELQNSGQLDQILKDFPKLVEASLNYELAKLEALSKMSPLIPSATRFLEDLTNFIEFITGKNKLNDDNKNVATTYGNTAIGAIASANPTTKGIWTGINLGKQGWEWITDKLKSNNTSTKSIGETTALSWVNKYTDITPQKKDEVKEMIKNDNQTNYTITINGGESQQDMVKLLIDEIERIQANN